DAMELCFICKLVGAATRLPTSHSSQRIECMPKKTVNSGQSVSRDKLAALLNEDLGREYQAIIAYVIYSQVLKGAEYMNIADQLATHAQHRPARAHKKLRQCAAFPLALIGR